MQSSSPADVISLQQRGLATRQQFASAKRGLKSGTVTLAEALTLPCTQNRTVLELLGYAVIGDSPTPYRGGQPRVSGGHARRALAIAAAVPFQLDFHTLVEDLSPQERRLLCRYAAATLRAPASAAS